MLVQNLHCAGCGAAIKEDAASCEICGAACDAYTKICYYCGKRVELDSACGTCGNDQFFKYGAQENKMFHVKHF